MTMKRLATATTEEIPAPPGPVSIFRRKIRKPVTLTLTPEHHAKLIRAMKRLKLSRADTIGLLIDQHADTVRRP